MGSPDFISNALRLIEGSALSEEEKTEARALCLQDAHRIAVINQLTKDNITPTLHAFLRSMIPFFKYI